MDIRNIILRQQQQEHQQQQKIPATAVTEGQHIVTSLTSTAAWMSSAAETPATAGKHQQQQVNISNSGDGRTAHRL
jgi:hypothetical protein